MAGVGQRLEIRQGQSLVMTPQLQQAIKLLQLSNIELTEFVEAELERNPLLERQENEADPREKQAEAYAFRRVNGAKGDTEKFALLLAEYAKAPEITRQRLYFESMQSILPALDRKVIVDDSIKGVLQTLPLLPSLPTATPAPQP